MLRNRAQGGQHEEVEHGGGSTVAKGVGKGEKCQCVEDRKVQVCVCLCLEQAPN